MTLVVFAYLQQSNEQNKNKNYSKNSRKKSRVFVVVLIYFFRNNYVLCAAIKIHIAQINIFHLCTRPIFLLLTVMSCSCHFTNIHR